MLYSGFVGGSYVSQSPIADQERLMNWYVEQLESQGATSPSALYPTPGVTSLSKSTSAPGRAHFAQDGREFAVIGTQFVEVNSTGGQTILGTVAIDSNPATISSNGAAGGQLFITSGNNGYVLTLSTNAFAQVRTGATTQGDSLDGYFLALDAATATVFISNLLDGATWDPTQFIQRSSQSDPWVSMKVSSANRYIYLFGSQTSEVWYDAGTFPIPFVLNPSGAIPYGCVAPFSPTVCQGIMLWLGSTSGGQGLVYSAPGLGAQAISTFALTYALAQYPTLSDAIGDTYSDLGHTFYLLTFPTAQATWAYDLNTTSPLGWAERGTWIAENNAFTHWRPMYHVFAFNQHRMLDLQTGNLYQMSSTIGTDVDERPIRRMRRAPGIQFERERIFYSAFELDLETGLASIPDMAIPGGITSQAVAWSNESNVTAAVDSTLSIVSGAADGMAISSQTLQGDGYIQAIATLGTGGASFQNAYLGLGPTTQVAPYPTLPLQLSYAFNMIYVGATQVLNVYESGVLKLATTYVVGDVLKIVLTGTTVTFLQNGSVIYTSLTPATVPLSYIGAFGALTTGLNLSTPTMGGDWVFSAIAVERAPQVMLRMSNDGGKTWGSETLRSVGKIGEYGQRVKWTRCGTARRRVFEVSVTDNVPWRVMNAYLTPLQQPTRATQIQRAQWEQTG